MCEEATHAMVVNVTVNGRQITIKYTVNIIIMKERSEIFIRKEYCIPNMFQGRCAAHQQLRENLMICTCIKWCKMLINHLIVKTLLSGKSIVFRTCFKLDVRPINNRLNGFNDLYPKFMVRWFNVLVTFT